MIHHEIKASGRDIASLALLRIQCLLRGDANKNRQRQIIATAGATLGGGSHFCVHPADRWLWPRSLLWIEPEMPWSSERRLLGPRTKSPRFGSSIRWVLARPKISQIPVRSIYFSSFASFFVRWFDQIWFFEDR